MTIRPSRVCAVAVLGIGLAIAPAVTATAATAETPTSQSQTAASLAPVGSVRLEAGKQLVGTGVLGATVTVTDANDQVREARVSKLGEWEVSAKGLTGPLAIRQTLLGAASAVVAFGDAKVADVRVTTGAVVGTGTPSATIIVRDANGTRLTTTVGADGSWSVPSDGLVAQLVIRQRILGHTSKAVKFGSAPDAPVVSYRSGDLLVGDGTRFATVTVTDANGETRSTADADRWKIDVSGLTGPLTVHQTLLGLDSEKVTWGEAPAAPTVDYRSGDNLVGSGERYATVTITDANGTTRTSTNGERWVIDITGLTGPLTVHQSLLGLDSEKVTWGEAPAAPTVDYRSGDNLVGSGERYATVTITDADGTTRTSTNGERWVIDISGLTGPLTVHQTLLGLDSEAVTYTL
ncbi:hypothetical protein [Curtobacterium sp. GD1]|uniref:hypothetical protein n=1 Tax=Curtobacterium sp. GD1 TaxID=2810612 RepID=UPI001E4BA403|nr:hypothetical protein [Curtobacterium sp. GD1]MCC8906539.1 hypothetical protein [Curtobacterium sp. GD1]